MKKTIRHRRFLALICTMVLLAMMTAGCGQKTEPEQAGAEKVAEAVEEKPAAESAQETEAVAAEESEEESEEEINIEEIVEASSEMATLDTGDSGAFLGAAPSGSYGSVAASEFEGDYYFDTDKSFLILADGNTTQVYTGGTMEGAYFSVEEVELEGGIGETIVSRIKEVTEFLGVRMIGQPKVQLLETGNRRLAGFVTTYSAVDGSKTIVAEEFYEEIGGKTYCWYAIYDKGDEVTPMAFKWAMQSFTLK